MLSVVGKMFEVDRSGKKGRSFEVDRSVVLDK